MVPLITAAAPSALNRDRSSPTHPRLRSERLYMDAPNVAKRSVHESMQDQIAPVHSDFCCGLRRCP
jgi:hypothetical protein